jgi:hypothetical protein
LFGLPGERAAQSRRPTNLAQATNRKSWELEHRAVFIHQDEIIWWTCLN